jgi:hypothetical protein
MIACLPQNICFSLLYHGPGTGGGHSTGACPRGQDDYLILWIRGCYSGDTIVFFVRNTPGNTTLLKISGNDLPYLGGSCQ